MYLKHLLTDRGIPVYDRRSGAIGVFDEEVVIALIGSQHFKAIGNRRAIHEVRNLGQIPWKAVMLAAEAAGYKPSEARPAKYSHNRETSYNPKNCWTLIRLTSSTKRIYRQVQTDCLAAFRDTNPS